jgi:hypothetical protein
MSTDEAETPAASRAGSTTATGVVPRVTKTPPARPNVLPPSESPRRFAAPRYLVLCLLGIAMLASLGGWIAMVLMDKEVPEGFPVVIGTVIGGLVGIAATDRS